MRTSCNKYKRKVQHVQHFKYPDKCVRLMVNLQTKVTNLKTYSNPEITRFFKVKPGTARLI